MFYDINGIKMNTVSFGSGEDTFLGISGFVADWQVWTNVFELLSTNSDLSEPLGLNLQ